MLPGVLLFFAGLAAALGSSWFNQRKGRRAASWLVMVLVLSIPYGLAAWWLWELDDDRFPWEALGPAGLVVGFIAAHFLYESQNADRD